MDITSVNGSNSWKFRDDTMTGTWWKKVSQTDRWTDRQTDSVLRAALSQLKNMVNIKNCRAIHLPPMFAQNTDFTLMWKLFIITTRSILLLHYPLCWFPIGQSYSLNVLIKHTLYDTTIICFRYFGCTKAPFNYLSVIEIQYITKWYDSIQVFKSCSFLRRLLWWHKYDWGIKKHIK